MAFEPLLPFDDEWAATAHVEWAPDAQARARAMDPSRNVVLEASAGTGKTRVLVERYVNLLRAGVEPDNILAITFTRKAAAEMRQRIVDRLREASRLSPLDAARWRDLHGRLGDISICTIDAFCLSLLREFPLEADVDPAFDLADETEIPRLVEEALDRSLRICRHLAKDEEDVALVFAQLGERRLRGGLAALLERRLVAPELLRRFLSMGPRDLTGASACRLSADRLRNLFSAIDGGLRTFLTSGPLRHRQFAMLAADIARLCRPRDADAVRTGPEVGGSPQTIPRLSEYERQAAQAEFRAFVDRLRAYFVTQEGKPRGERFSGTGFKGSDCQSEQAWKRHRDTAAAIAPSIAEAIRAFRRDLNVVLSRGIWRMFAITLSHYRQTLEARALLDFAGVLERTVDLLKQMDEFARSRYRLESRYRHVLVDEFQDTSRAQWNLVAHLVRSWGEGLGASSDALAPSIFIVGDRKQSIYAFRDAEVGLMEEAAEFIAALRGDDARHAISLSFRAPPQLLAFVNDVFRSIVASADAPARQAFRYDEQDRFPLGETVQMKTDVTEGSGTLRVLRAEEPPLGLVVASTVARAAEAVADEIVRLLSGALVRDRISGIARVAQPGDIAILFRSRESHREFEAALERRGVQTYVYKGLGFFEADEIQDAVSALRYLADPTSDLRAAAFLRSRVVRLSDPAINQLAPGLAKAILQDGAAGECDVEKLLSQEDRTVLAVLRVAVSRWLTLVDRVSPAELLDRVLYDSAYHFELRGPRRLQARENLKKLRSLLRRIQNRGYVTLARIADHLERLAVGDESNAAIDAVDAVSLMTIHAAKGLEFPIVFVVNMGRGTGGVRPSIRIATSASGQPSVAVGDFQSESDDEAQARDREETKRLLYVALTRARDRLYLSATVENGVCRTGRGSLGEVMPKSLIDLFVEAAQATLSESTVIWSPAGGQSHLLLSRGHDPSASTRVWRARATSVPRGPDDFASFN
ncbi:MAG: hypothetical protein C5B57_07550 [Blastocatellia bacterium]|nr:MAG: hypothetical protein C5B57_07550 [Blastocatellia bacterium]